MSRQISYTRCRTRTARVLRCALLAAAVAATPAARAEARNASHPPDVAALCDHAAVAAATRWNVPLDVMRAISLTETGRRSDGELRPWPWTVNMEGKGVWFDTPEDARSYVDRHFARGARSFDVGCFQINYRWHGDAFASVEAMFDPVENADYAARFLSELHGELGDWSRAAGAYHSRTPEYANRYRARFDSLRARIAGQPVPETGDLREAARLAGATPGDGPGPAAPVRMPRINTFPLLKASGAPLGLGSLVPLDGTSAARPLVPSG